MLSPEDHNTLKSILLYQAVLEYLKNWDLVKEMELDELESFQSIVMECFETCKNYKGSVPELNSGCSQLLSTKEDISKIFPNLGIEK